MGIFNSYLDDIQKEINRVADGLDAAQNTTKKVVGAIDALEEKVNHLPDEKQMKKKLKNKLKTVAAKTKNNKRFPSKK